MVLHAGETGPPVPFGRIKSLGELPGVHGGRADVTRLAGLDHVVQRLQGLLDRGRGVPAVNLVEVHVVGAEPAQAVVDLGHDRLAGQAGAVRARPHPAVHLGGEHDLVPAGEFPQRTPGDLLAGPVAVDVGAIEEVDAGLDRPPDERARLTPRPATTDGRPGRARRSSCSRGRSATRPGRSSRAWRTACVPSFPRPAGRAPAFGSHWRRPVQLASPVMTFVMAGSR